MKYKKSELFMSPEEAANEIGVSPHLIRLWLQNGKFDFGSYDKRDGAKVGGYTIFRHKFEQFKKEYCGLENEKDTLPSTKLTSV